MQLKTAVDRVNPRDTLLALDPRDFEYLIAAAYHGLGYDVRLTPRSSDGGLDVEIRRPEAGRAEASYAECKRYEGSVGVITLRALMGVVAIKNAARGILVTSGTITRAARDFAKATSQLDVVEYPSLNRLLNTAFGPEWPLQLDRHIWWMKRLEVLTNAAFVPGRRSDV
jgi:restriction system protein